ncbi:unnamed protein product, partial [marine sediment metagenome]
ADNSGTYVYSYEDDSTWREDSYGIPTYTGSKNINNVRLYLRIYIDWWSSYHGWGKGLIRINSRSYYTDTYSHVAGWETHYHNWATSPATSSNWTKSEVRSSQIGVALLNSYMASVRSRCTQVYVEVDYTTIVAPTTTTQAVSDIGTTTSTGNGNMIDNGGENASKRGVCWNTTGNPTVADDKSEETDSFGVGAFTRPMTGLSPSTHYYVKAYAYNSAGYGYGSQVEFDTLTLHEVEVTDGIALTDTLVKTPMLFKSDGIALSDVLVKTMDKRVTDGIAFKDVLVKLQIHVRTFTDGIAFKDVLVKTISKTLTDSIAFKDVISYVKNPTKLAKLIRKLLQLEGIGGGKED